MLRQWRRRQSCALTAAPLCYDVRPFRALREETKRLEALRRRTDFLPSGRVALRGDSRRQRPACASSFARETLSPACQAHGRLGPLQRRRKQPTCERCCGNRTHSEIDGRSVAAAVICGEAAMLCHTTLKPHRIRTKSMRCGSLPADPSAAIAEKANVPAGIFNVRRLIERRLRIPPLKHTHTRTHARTHACVCAHTQTHSRTIFHTQAQLEKARRSRFRGLHARICGPCQIANSSISGRIYRPDRLPESREANCRVRNWRDGPCPRAFRLRLRLPWACGAGASGPGPGRSGRPGNWAGRPRAAGSGWGTGPAAAAR